MVTDEGKRAIQDEDAWVTYDRSLERLVSQDDPINERIRQAFEAGYAAGSRAPLDAVFAQLAEARTLMHMAEQAGVIFRRTGTSFGVELPR